MFFSTPQNREYVFVSSLAKTGERLARLVELLDFSKRYKFIGIMEKDYPEIMETLKRHNIETDLNVEYLLFTLPREDALGLEPK